MIAGTLVHFRATLLREGELHVVLEDTPGKPSVLLQLEHAVNWLDFELPLWLEDTASKYYYTMLASRDGVRAEPYFFEVKLSRGREGAVDFFSLEPLLYPPGGFEEHLPPSGYSGGLDPDFD